VCFSSENCPFPKNGVKFRLENQATPTGRVGQTAFHVDQNVPPLQHFSHVGEDLAGRLPKRRPETVAVAALSF